MYKRRYGVNPWGDLDRLQQEMNNLFESTFTTRRRRQASGFPAMNVWTNEDGVVVTAELPGVDADKIDISVVGDTLTLSGNREVVEASEKVEYHRRERSYGKFSRIFQLPFAVETNHVEAVFEKGILQISLPRAETAKPRKITVKSA